MSGRVELFRDQAGEWRWRRKAANNRIVASSGEGYGNYGDALERASEEASAHNVELEIDRELEPGEVAE